MSDDGQSGGTRRPPPPGVEALVAGVMRARRMAGRASDGVAPEAGRLVTMVGAEALWANPEPTDAETEHAAPADAPALVAGSSLTERLEKRRERAWWMAEAPSWGLLASSCADGPVVVLVLVDPSTAFGMCVRPNGALG